MSEMVERVAKAIYESAPLFMAAGISHKTLQRIPWDELDERNRREAREAAVEAIKAMRQPTKAMEDAGDELGDWGCPSDPGPGNAGALAHWVAMIDEALK